MSMVFTLLRIKWHPHVLLDSRGSGAKVQLFLTGNIICSAMMRPPFCGVLPNVDGTAYEKLCGHLRCRRL